MTTPSTKPEVHVVAYRNAAREGARATGITHKILVKFGHVAFELYEQTDRQTDKQKTDKHNSSPYRKVISMEKPK